MKDIQFFMGELSADMKIIKDEMKLIKKTFARKWVEKAIIFTAIAFIAPVIAAIVAMVIPASRASFISLVF